MCGRLSRFSNHTGRFPQESPKSHSGYPYEFSREIIRAKDHVIILDTIGTSLGEAEVISVHGVAKCDNTLVVEVEAPVEIASRIAAYASNLRPLPNHWTIM